MRCFPRRRSRLTQLTALLLRLTSLGLVIGLASPAVAVVKIDITAGKIDPLPVAVTRFVGNDDDTSKIGLGMTDVIVANLSRSGLFAPIDPERVYPETRRHAGAAALRRLALDRVPSSHHR